VASDGDSAARPGRLAGCCSSFTPIVVLRSATVAGFDAVNEGLQDAASEIHVPVEQYGPVLG
jgi:hypothetical protein